MSGIIPNADDIGEYAMVSRGYPGRMQIAGRLVELQSVQMRADGKQWFICRLLDDSSPHGDRYPLRPTLDATLLELCNIDVDRSKGRTDWHCFTHGVHADPEGRAKWHLPTPPKFKSQAEADEWMAQHEERVRTHQQAEEYVDEYGVKHFPPIGAFDPDVTPDWDNILGEDANKAIFDLLQKAIKPAPDDLPF